MVLVCKFTIELRSDKHTIFTVMDATEVDSMLQTWVIRRSLDGRDLCWRDVYGGHDKSLSHGWWILGAHISALHRAAVVICCLIVEQRPSGRDADIIRTRLRITGSPRGREQDQPSKHKVVFLEMSTCLVEVGNFSPLGDRETKSNADNSRLAHCQGEERKEFRRFLPLFRGRLGKMWPEDILNCCQLGQIFLCLTFLRWRDKKEIELLGVQIVQMPGH